MAKAHAKKITTKRKQAFNSHSYKLNRVRHRDRETEKPRPRESLHQTQIFGHNRNAYSIYSFNLYQPTVIYW